MQRPPGYTGAAARRLSAPPSLSPALPAPPPPCSLDVYERLGGPAAVQRHTEALRAWLYARLAGLRHSNGAPLLRIMGRHADDAAGSRQGATFNFQLLKPDGGLFSYRSASGVLAEAGFHMRCGCTCNPGACYGKRCAAQGVACGGAGGEGTRHPSFCSACRLMRRSLPPPPPAAASRLCGADR